MLAGFGLIASIIAVGYLLGRRGILGDQPALVLSRLAFTVATPAFLFDILADADLGVLFSPLLAVTSLAAVAAAVVFGLVGAVSGWGVRRTTIGALCASYVNAGNLGIPIAVYVLGEAVAVVPVLLFQLTVLSPIALTVLELTSERSSGSLLRRLTAPLRNPILLASLLGVLVSVSGIDLPAVVRDPVHQVGAMAVALVLLAFGLSLHGSPPPGQGGERAPVALAVTLKLIGTPLLAWALGAHAFGLEGTALFTVVVLAALPCAQNLYTYAVAYGSGEELARESILLETVLAAPVLVAIAALLG